QSHQLSDACTPIATLRNELPVSKALHQHDPSIRNAHWVPAEDGRLGRKPIARDRRNHQMESVRCACAMYRRIGEWIDDLQLLDYRAGPPVCDDQRQRTFVLRTNVNEMNVLP